MERTVPWCCAPPMPAAGVDLDACLAVALDAAREAGAVIEAAWHKPRSIEHKGEGRVAPQRCWWKRVEGAWPCEWLGVGAGVSSAAQGSDRRGWIRGAIEEGPWHHQREEAEGCVTGIPAAQPALVERPARFHGRGCGPGDRHGPGV